MEMVPLCIDSDAVLNFYLQNRKLVTSVVLWQGVDQLYLYTRVRSKCNEALRMEVLPWDGQVREGNCKASFRAAAACNYDDAAYNYNDH